MTASKIFIYGDSHTVAIADAYETFFKSSPLGFYDVSIARISDVTDENGNLKLTDAINVISDLSADDSVFISILGTAHNIYGLLQHPEKFDFFDQFGSYQNEDGVLLVPRSCMIALFKEIIFSNTILNNIKARAKCSVFHLSTPPPKESNDYILSKSVRYRGNLIADVGVSSPALRKKMWDLEMYVLAEACGENSVGFVSAPEDALTDCGFLNPLCYGGDATHSNKLYGKMVLEKIFSIHESLTIREF